MNTRQTGALGETLAEILLQEKGYRILAKNFRCRHGEIDIIAERSSIIAFVEVKTRLFASYGSGAEAVIEAKRRKIRKSAWCYLAMCERHFEAVDFQVIEISAFHLEGLEF